MEGTGPGVGLTKEDSDRGCVEGLSGMWLDREDAVNSGGWRGWMGDDWWLG